jgi:hypothetical protein
MCENSRCNCACECHKSQYCPSLKGYQLHDDVKTQVLLWKEIFSYRDITVKDQLEILKWYENSKAFKDAVISKKLYKEGNFSAEPAKKMKSAQYLILAGIYDKLGLDYKLVWNKKALREHYKTLTSQTDMTISANDFRQPALQEKITLLLPEETKKTYDVVALLPDVFEYYNNWLSKQKRRVIGGMGYEQLFDDLERSLTELGFHDQQEKDRLKDQFLLKLNLDKNRLIFN